VPALTACSRPLFAIADAMSTLPPLHGPYRRAARRVFLVCATMPTFAVPSFSQTVRPSPALNCVDRAIARAGFTVCEIPAAAIKSVEIAPALEPGTTTWTIARLDSSLRAHGQRVTVAMNAGIFDRDGRTLGLLVRDGRVLRPLNTSNGPDVTPPADVCDVANFFCPPNGVFYVTDGRPRIATTAEFRDHGPPLAQVQIATQSGPMLLERGQFARELPATWRRRISRNAVCVRDDETTLFVLGRDQTQASLAATLRDSLGCRDALFLDGSVSELFAGTCPSPSGQGFGAILYVTAPIATADSGCTHAAGKFGASDEPYSKLIFRVGATRAHSFEPLHTYYPGNTGYAIEIVTPFEFGLFGVAYEGMTFQGATPQQVPTATNTYALDWQARASLTDWLAVRGGLRVGDFHMRFEAPQATAGMLATEEFLAGPTGAIDLHLAGPLAASVSGALIYIPFATHSKIAYLSLLGSYTVGTPLWLKRILQ
jgi:uncharacterized protein YigE (DUF2233 family)